jgi:hypothetical protein
MIKSRQRQRFRFRLPLGMIEACLAMDVIS